jgi:hypothetical protein
MWNRKFQRTERSDRWQREDAAARLLDQLPYIRTIKFSLKETRAEHTVAGTTRAQHVIVARAGALFEIACSDPKCENGGHDLTTEVLAGLRDRLAEFGGNSDCHGDLGQGSCDRTLHYSVHATYAP